MKQLLFMLFSILIGLNTSSAQKLYLENDTAVVGLKNLIAQETNPNEDITWAVIQERLFSGENPKAFRFHEDIRFQLKGEVTKEDSVIMQNIVYELKDLIEVVDVQLVNENGNFIFTIYPPENSILSSRSYEISNDAISKVAIELNSKLISGESEKGKFFGYHSFYYLTKTFEPRIGRTGYFGIFDSPSFEQSGTIKEIDKNLIRKLYSNDFYKNLRKNTVEKTGYWFYLNLRYENLLNTISTTILVILAIIIFLYLLSKENNTNKLITFGDYLKKNIIALFGITFIFSFWFLFTFPQSLIFTDNQILVFLAAATGGIFIYGLLTLIPLYFIERFVFKHITNFAQRQIIIFSNTLLSVLIVYTVVSILLIFLTNYGRFNFIDSSTYVTTPILILIIITAFVRAFYNFINYRIQSMVNQKDVELAKMKELKNQAELNALHSRINPHFLYNSLNSIASLAHINPDKTENMATALSELFRYSINKEDKTFVRVEEELEMVKKYLEIEKTRFEDKLEYKIDVEENAKEKLIPKFLIQPLAENAIKHGLSKIKEVGIITIEVKQLENDLVITIFDNGPDFPEEPVSGYGLQNLNDKLEIIYGKEAFINWENGDNKHFKITIKNQFKDEAML